mmetsp:Transcript_15742/g.51430  ORF Transcript_15742/g.51430 Transcript_15742/m.51430 type:complete len:334 (-) Transcript_15742:374-1375(-)|eukprot:scaffold301_cov142-Isochrysis_galbana.AAC.3
MNSGQIAPASSYPHELPAASAVHGGQVAPTSTDPQLTAASVIARPTTPHEWAPAEVIAPSPETKYAVPGALRNREIALAHASPVRPNQQVRSPAAVSTAFARHSSSSYLVSDDVRVFLSYRVSTDHKLVESMYHKLKEKGVNVWWDRKALQPGQLWEQGFVDGLKSSDIFVPVLSKAALAPFEQLAADSQCDNVLLEYRMALELKDHPDGRLNSIFPVMVGPPRLDPELGEIYGHFLKSGGKPNAPDSVVLAVEDKLRVYLPLAASSPRMTTREVLDKILNHQGTLLMGQPDDTIEVAVTKIVESVKQVQAEKLNLRCSGGTTQSGHPMPTES